MCSLKISSEHTHTSYLVCCFCDSSITLKPSSCCCLDQGKPNFEEAGNKTITKVLHKQCVSLKQLSLSLTFPLWEEYSQFLGNRCFWWSQRYPFVKQKISITQDLVDQNVTFLRTAKKTVCCSLIRTFFCCCCFLLTGSSINPFVHHPDIHVIYSSSVVQFIDSVAHTWFDKNLW